MLLLAYAAARLCVSLDTPLPWMIGPLFATAAACMLHAPFKAPVPLRYAGQWAIGATLGLYFTAQVMTVLAAMAGWVALAVAFALVLGLAAGKLLQRLSGADGVTCFFAMAVGGASEMAAQGERHGAAVERVAAAHSVRMMLVVATIPFAIRWWSHHGLDMTAGVEAYLAGATEVHLPGLLALIALTSLAALAMMKLDSPNAWVIGPLLAAMALTACGIHLSRVPEWMIHLGQLFIGVSLGSRFTPAFAHTAPRFIGSALLCAALMIVVGAGFAALLSKLAAMNPGVAVLATSPGGIAEMSLTARVLNLGVPLVTAFHVTRMVAVVLLIGPLYRAIGPTDANR